MRVIETPSDFRGLMGDGYSLEVFVRPEPEREPEVRHTIEAIFNDLEYISPQDPELFSSYLDSIQEPLADLKAFGLQLAAHKTQGTLEVPAGAFPAADQQLGPVPWSQTYFFVTPRPCFYRVGDDGNVHMLGIGCEADHELTQKGAAVHWWTAPAVEVAFEGAVPWCNTCFLHLPRD